MTCDSPVAVDEGTEGHAVPPGGGEFGYGDSPVTVDEGTEGHAVPPGGGEVGDGDLLDAGDLTLAPEQERFLGRALL